MICSIPSGFNIGELEIKFYGLLIAIAMIIGIVLAMRNTKLRKLKGDNVLILACYVLPLAIVGARLYFVAFSGHSYTFWEVFQVWNGGLAIYGGVIGGAIGVFLFCVIHKHNFLDFADVVVPSLILGQAIGRWGNFFNQEAYGYAVDWHMFPFTVMIEHYCDCCGMYNQAHLATFFYEFVWNLIVFAGLMVALKKWKLRGSTMCLYFIGYGIGRAVIEGFRTDSLYIGSSALRVSQLLSILLIIGGIILLTFLIIWDKRKKKKKVETTDT